MAEENGSNKLITIVLAIVITFAAIAILYVSLPEENTKDNDTSNENEESQTEEEIILTINYNDEIIEYTLIDLETLEAYTGIGGYINKVNITTGPFEYTGITVTSLVDQVTNPPEQYSIKIKSSDGWEAEYDTDQIQGNVDLYNETGAKKGIGNVKMIVAYKEDGNYITDPENGPLRIAYVDDYYTSSSLWSRLIVSIEIIEE